MEKKKDFKNKDVRLLILNDSLQEKDLMVSQLQQAGYHLDVTYAKNETQFTEALCDKAFDIVLSGFRVRGFDAFRALELCHEFSPETPFICVSESVDEEKTTALLKKGAIDYVLKERPERLPIIFKNAITQSQEKADLRVALQRLETSENRFRQVALIAAEWIWEVDTNGLYTYVSPVIESMLGYTPDEVVGKKYFYDFFIPEEREDLKKAAFKTFVKKEIFKNFENLIVHKNGNIVKVSTNGSPILDQSGNLIGYQGIDTDFTELKRSERLIEENVERAQKQLSLIAELTFDDSVVNGMIDEALKLITTKLAANLQVDRTSLWMLSEDQKELRRLMLYDAGTGIDSQIEKLNTADIPLYFEALRTDSQIDADDALNDLRTKELTDDYLIPVKISSLLDSAIKQNGDLIGVLSVEHRGTIRQWHSVEKSFLIAITNLVVRLFANADRKRAEEVMRESEVKYRALFNQSMEGIYLHDLEGRVLDVNDIACKQSGRTKKEWFGLTVFNGHPSQSIKNLPKEEILKIWKGWDPGQRFTIEVEHQRKDGTIYPVEISTGKIRYGNKQAILAIVKDITERKQIKEKLKLLNRAIESSSMSIIITDEKGSINYINPFFTEVTGYTFEEVQGKNPRILKSGKQSKTFYKNLWDTIKSGKDWSGNLQNKKKSGELYWEKAVISPMVNKENGEITNFVAIKEDITELLKKEDELNQSLKEKEILLSEIHHRVKNNLAVVSALLQLKSDDENNSEVKKILDIGVSKIKTISNIHEQLYKSESFSRIELSSNIRTLTQDLIENLSYGKKIETDLSLEQIHLNVNQSVPLSLIVNEVIVNALKHAFVNRSTGKIAINLSKTGNRVQLKIIDDGIGICNDLKQKELSSGMLIIDILSQQLRGQYQYKRIKTGTEFSFSFEKSDVKGSTSSFL